MSIKDIDTATLKFTAREAPTEAMRIQAARELLARGESTSDDPEMSAKLQQAYAMAGGGTSRACVRHEGRVSTFGVRRAR